jgi:hypothetical protein
MAKKLRKQNMADNEIVQQIAQSCHVNDGYVELLLQYV